MKSGILRVLALWLFPSSFLAGFAANAVPARPNVLLIAVDDLNDYIWLLQNHSGTKTPT